MFIFFFSILINMCQSEWPFWKLLLSKVCWFSVRFSQLFWYQYVFNWRDLTNVSPFPILFLYSYLLHFYAVLVNVFVLSTFSFFSFKWLIPTFHMSNILSYIDRSSVCMANAPFSSWQYNMMQMLHISPVK